MRHKEDCGAGDAGVEMAEDPAEPEDVEQGLLQVIAGTAKEEPLGLRITKEEHIIMCELPAERLEVMQGPDGEFIAEVERETDARLRFEDVEPDDGPPKRLVVLEGPLLEVYQAHAIMMARYHETEPDVGPQSPGEGSPDEAELLDSQGIDDGEYAEESCADEGPRDAAEAVAIRAELAELEKRLAMVREMKYAKNRAAGVGLPAESVVAALTPKPAAVRVMEAKTIRPPKPQGVQQLPGKALGKGRGVPVWGRGQ